MGQQQLELDINSKIQIDDLFTVKKYPSSNLILFHDLPNWVVLHPDEYLVFTDFSNYTIKNLFDRHEESIVINTIRKFATRDIIGTNQKIVTKKGPIHPSLFVYITNECNLRCKHCYMFSGKKNKNELDFEQWKEIIISYLENDGREIIFCGGEPFTSPHLVPLIKLAKGQSPNVKIRVFTNGSFLDQYSPTFYNEYVDEIQISFDGPVDVIHDNVRGEGHFQIILRNFNSLKSYTGLVTIAMSFFDENTVVDFSENFDDFIDNASDMVSNLRVNIITELLQGRCHKKATFSEANLKTQTFIQKMEDHTKQDFYILDDTLLTRNVKNSSCGYGSTLTVSSQGFIFPCGLTRQQPLGFFEENSVTEWIALLEKNQCDFDVEKMPYCKTCDLKYICGGTCRIENKSQKGSFLSSNCTDLYKEEIYHSLYRNDISFEKNIS